MLRPAEMYPVGRRGGRRRSLLLHEADGPIEAIRITTCLQIERVISGDDGYVVVDRFVAQDYLGGDGILTQMDPTSQDPHVREEALRTLYRLRAEFRKRNDRSSSLLKAIESLIVEYEEKRT